MQGLLSRWRWCRLLSPPLDGAVNMAADETLMTRAVRTGEATLRVYSWMEPTLSFGRHQRAVGVYDRERLRAAGIACVRRPTGGRALLHHREVTYSVTAPAEGTELRHTYHAVNELLCAALRSLGLDARIAGTGRRAVEPGPLPCFDVPSAGELTLEGRKLAGSAQWRAGGALLQHGSILLADDQSRLPELANVPLPPVPRPATLSDALAEPPGVAELADVLFRELRRRAAEVREMRWGELQSAIPADVADRYRDESWTWRR